jgi:hypothetical protein
MWLDWVHQAHVVASLSMKTAQPINQARAFYSFLVESALYIGVRNYFT